MSFRELSERPHEAREATKNRTTSDACGTRCHGWLVVRRSNLWPDPFTAMVPRTTRSELMKKRKINRPTESLGDRITRMSDEYRQDWVDELLAKITDETVMGLHHAGWKIVNQDDSTPMAV